MAPSADRYEISCSQPVEGPNVDLFLRGKRLARGPVESAIDRLIWETSSRAFARSRYLFVHAGVVARDGAAVLLPAPPGHGKSTTVAGLVQAGFDFLSDEAAALDVTDGTVHPFPRPIMLSPSSVDAIRLGTPPHIRSESETGRAKQPVALGSLRRGSLGTPARVAFIVAPSYQDGGTTRVSDLSRSDALQLMAEQSFNLRKIGADGFRLLGKVAAEARCFRLMIGDLATAVDAVGNLLPMGGS